MKKITYSLHIIAVIALLLTSCKDEDFLVERPRDITTPDNLYQSQEGFQRGIYGLYALVKRERYRLESKFFGSHFESILNAQMVSGVDNSFINHTDGYLGNLYLWRSNLNPSWNQNYYTYQWVYLIINSANTIIDRAESAEINWTEQEKNETIAVARTIRAWAYRHATYLWGKVPLLTKESDGGNIQTDLTRAELEDIYKVMEEDLLFGEKYLPEADEASHPMAVTKAVAQHYLSELYLRMGAYELAEQKARAVIESGDYALITQRYGVNANEPGVPFMDQFQDGNVLRNQGNTEVLWAWVSEPIGTGEEDLGSYMRRYFLNRYEREPSLGGDAILEYGGIALGRFGMTKYAYDLYEEGDDRGSEYAIRKYYIALKSDESKGISPGDTVWTTVYDPELSEAEKFEKMVNQKDRLWPSPRKWEYVYPDPAKKNEGRTYKDEPYLRLAETYLLLAEALHMQDKNNDAAYYINILRDRAHASHVDAGDITIDFILDERSRELLAEEERRYSLLRTHTWYERYKKYNPVGADNIEPYHNLFPIPQAVIDANINVKMEQNTGYN